MTSRVKCCVWAVRAFGLTLALISPVGATLPRTSPVVWNRPLVLPEDGVLAVWGGVDQVTDASGEVAGATETYYPGDGARPVTIWRPDRTFTQGAARAATTDYLRFHNEGFSIGANPAVDELSLTMSGSVQARRQVLGTGFPCGAVAELRPAIELRYAWYPSASIAIRLDNTPEAISQFLFRSSTLSSHFTGFFESSGAVLKEGAFCVSIDTLSLQSGRVRNYDPFCVPDDQGIKWEVEQWVNSDELDSQLLECTRSPGALQERFCAVHKKQGDTPDTCKGYSQADLDAALADSVDFPALDAALQAELAAARVVMSASVAGAQASASIVSSNPISPHQGVTCSVSPPGAANGASRWFLPVLGAAWVKRRRRPRSKPLFKTVPIATLRVPVRTYGTTSASDNRGTG